MSGRLEDTSPMPFGCHKGMYMQDVPVGYLHWLWCNGKQFDRLCPVADYIRRNLECLKRENDNLIWE